MYCPNFMEFYQKDIIPIGPKDRRALLKHRFTVNADSSHWLIALDGRPSQSNHLFYTWTVVVYQANADGFFLLKKEPYYLSESFSSFDEACAAAEKIAQFCRMDRFAERSEEQQIVS